MGLGGFPPPTGSQRAGLGRWAEFSPAQRLVRGFFVKTLQGAQWLLLPRLKECLRPSEREHPAALALLGRAALGSPPGPGCGAAAALL